MTNELLNIIISTFMVVLYLIFELKIRRAVMRKADGLLELKNEKSERFKDFSKSEVMLMAKAYVLGVAGKFSAVPLMLIAVGVLVSGIKNLPIILIAYIITILILIGYSALTLRRQYRQIAFNGYEYNRIGIEEARQRITKYNRESSDKLAKKVQSFGRNKEESQQTDDFIQSYKVISNFAITANLIVLLQIAISVLIFIL